MKRYNTRSTIEEEGKIIYPRREPVKFESAFNTQHIALTGQTLMDMAFALYGDATAWWVIADMNDILDPTGQFEGGEILTVPVLREVVRRVR